MANLRILLADDHAVVREGLKRLIESQEDMEVVGEAADGRDAVSQAVAQRPDVVVLDVSMAPMGGAEAARELRQRCPRSRLLALTVHEDKAYMHEMLEAGAAGYVLKRAAGQELIGAIRTIAAGGVYVDPRVAGKLVSSLIGSMGSSRHAKGVATERETEVLRLIAQGYTNKEIGVQLGVSVKTVETYKARAMEKLGLRSRVDIVRLANERGWLGTR